MEEAIKNRIILILGILIVILLVGALGSCMNARQLKTSREEEFSKRLTVEEKLNKFSAEKSAMEQKIGELEKQLAQEKTGHEVTQKALAQEQLISSSLKEELEKLNKLKETLEEDLKEALAASGKITSTKNRK